MVLTLIIGDTHIPMRAHQIPQKFQALLVPGKIQYILCTGNVCNKQTYEFLRGVAPDVTIVRGDFDENSSWPETKVVTIEKFKIGLCHGHQVVPWGDHEALAALQRQLDCDILVTGHTHTLETFEMNGKFFANPGSATGAYSALSPDVKPSFLLMDIQGNHVFCYQYRLIDDKVEVSKTTFSRQQELGCSDQFATAAVWLLL